MKNSDFWPRFCLRTDNDCYLFRIPLNKMLAVQVFILLFTIVRIQYFQLHALALDFDLISISSVTCPHRQISARSFH